MWELELDCKHGIRLDSHACQIWDSCQVCILHISIITEFYFQMFSSILLILVTDIISVLYCADYSTLQTFTIL